MLAFAKKWLQYAAMAYLAFAAIGTFAFSAIDASFLADSSKSPLVLTAGDSRFDCFAIAPAKAVQTDWRTLPRVIVHHIFLAACAGLVSGLVAAADKTIPKTSIKTIILKLRN